ncbi:RNA polymerase sigma factor [Pseudonocardia spinosispora]|uniref:RNA polymerase sigma factor n=1 Tax=Pseudonocardia spinosispora TaxID=103441 RepID=UPI0004273EA7|nr:sigma-70 family RNA polymerase sigma factor [Pseudonocardia spinosispora]
MVLTATAIDDETLVVRAREGDLTAFEALVTRYQKRIYQLALRMTRDRGDAEDITQEVFLTAWRRLPEIHREAAFSGWLYTTATNRCLTVLRKRRPTEALDEEQSRGEPAWMTVAGRDPQSSAQNMAQLAALSEALGRLTAQQRVVWLLREAHGRSYEEIARIVDTTPASVRGRLSRARIQLAELMSPWH